MRSSRAQHERTSALNRREVRRCDCGPQMRHFLHVAFDSATCRRKCSKSPGVYFAEPRTTGAVPDEACFDPRPRLQHFVRLRASDGGAPRRNAAAAATTLWTAVDELRRGGSAWLSLRERPRLWIPSSGSPPDRRALLEREFPNF